MKIGVKMSATPEAIGSSIEGTGLIAGRRALMTPDKAGFATLMMGWTADRTGSTWLKIGLTRGSAMV